MVGVEVKSFDAVPKELGRMRVPAARYAVFLHEGNVATIQETWKQILSSWLPKSGMESNETPDFEVYDERFDGASGETLRLGRDATCEIVIVDRGASRQHARIEKRRSKFVLVDQSSNGTSVVMAGEGEIYLRREELVLRTNGSIGVGHHVGDQDATKVEFYCL